MVKIRLFAVLILFFVLFISTTFCASIRGEVYDERIETVIGAIVRLEKEGILYGQVITNTSGYVFENVSAGEYRLVASAKINNKTLQTAAILNLSEADSIHVDLVLFEEFAVEVPEIITDIGEDEEFIVPIEKEEPKPELIDWVSVGFIVGIFIAIIILFIYLRRTGAKLKKELEEAIEKEREKEKEEIISKKEPEEPTMGRYLTDEEKIYQIIQRRKELPQKEIVIETGFSGAKVSLILKKLEKMGKIKRETIGREKIIKFVE